MKSYKEFQDFYNYYSVAVVQVAYSVPYIISSANSIKNDYSYNNIYNNAKNLPYDIFLNGIVLGFFEGNIINDSFVQAAAKTIDTLCALWDDQLEVLPDESLPSFAQVCGLSNFAIGAAIEIKNTHNLDGDHILPDYFAGHITCSVVEAAFDTLTGIVGQNSSESI